MPPATHFIFIPAVLMIGVVIGWILGSRAAKDAYAMELKRREERQARGKGRETRAEKGRGASRTGGRRRRRAVTLGSRRDARSGAAEHALAGFERRRQVDEQEALTRDPRCRSSPVDAA